MSMRSSAFSDARAQLDATTLGVLDRVADQVAQDDGQEHGVAAHELGGSFDRQFERLAARRVTEFGAQARKDLFQGKIANDRVDGALFQAVDVDERGEHLVHALHRFSKQLELRGAPRVLHHALQHRLYAPNRLQGLAQSWLAAARNRDLISFA